MVKTSQEREVSPSKLFSLSPESELLFELHGNERKRYDKFGSFHYKTLLWRYLI